MLGQKNDEESLDDSAARLAVVFIPPFFIHQDQNQRLPPLQETWNQHSMFLTELNHLQE